jgi:hypothetical protein
MSVSELTPNGGRIDRFWRGFLASEVWRMAAELKQPTTHPTASSNGRPPRGGRLARSQTNQPPSPEAE